MGLKHKVNVYIPTLNAGKIWEEVVKKLTEQTYPISRVVIIDSGSTDGTLEKIKGDFELISVDKKDFDHGGTRKMAINRYPDADICLFLTQDAIPANELAIENMVTAFDDHPKLGMVYGRQLPHKDAKTLESHARIFNYPPTSQVRSLKDADKYGIKTISCSNSFAAYRRSAYEQAGGFSSGTILGEDVIIAGRILLNGWDMAYLADSMVYHSHDYSVKEEFKRYFDIGVFHATNSWIFDHFGRAESEGFKYLHSEIAYVMKRNPASLPKSIFSLFAKWLGYKIGLNHQHFPKSVNRSLSMHKAYWQHPSD